MRELLPFSHATDLPATLLGYGLAIGFIVWLRRSHDVSWTQVAQAAARLAIIFAIGYGFCFLVGITVWLPAGVLFGAASAGALVFSVSSLMLLGAACEFILGIPLHNDTLAPPSISVPDPTMTNSELVACEGIALSPLKPSGEVRVNGERFAAISDGSKFLDVDEKITVIAVKNGTLVVKTCESPVN